jgi:hypothetical protein
MARNLKEFNLTRSGSDPCFEVLGSENPIPMRDRESRVNAINKAEFIGWQARVKLPHRHTGPIGQTRPRASLGKILCRPSLAVTAKPAQYIANEFVTPHTFPAYPFKSTLLLSL